MILTNPKYPLANLNLESKNSLLLYYATNGLFELTVAIPAPITKPKPSPALVQSSPPVAPLGLQCSSGYEQCLLPPFKLVSPCHFLCIWCPHGAECWTFSSFRSSRILLFPFAFSYCVICYTPGIYAILEFRCSRYFRCLHIIFIFCHFIWLLCFEEDALRFSKSVNDILNALWA